MLAKLHAYGNTSDPFVVSELAEMKAKIEEERDQEQGWAEIFHNPNNLRKIFMGIIVQFSVQMTGVSAIQYYSPWVAATSLVSAEFDNLPAAKSTLD